MLEKLSIRSFQKHKKFTLDLSPTVTVLTGKTNSGKSSILRALRFLTLNKHPTGKYINFDATSTTIKLRVDGHNIIRKKGKGENCYILDGKKYVSFGASVPDDIAKVLNISAISMQRQHDPIFWFSLSAGEVSKQLNQIVNLAVIDETLAAVSSAVRKARTTADVCKDRLAKAKERKEELAWIPDFCSKVKHLEELDQQCQSLRSESLRIAALLLEGQRLTHCIQTHSRGILTLAKVIQRLEEVIRLQQRQERIDSLIEQIKEAEQLCGITLPDLSALEAKFNRVQQLEKKQEWIEQLTEQIRGEEERQCQLRKELEKCNVRLAQWKGKDCPFCGSILT